MSGLAAALLTLPLLPSVAAAQLAVSSNDGKAVLVNGVNTVPPNPADDTVTIIDLGAVDTEGIYDGRMFKAERWAKGAEIGATKRGKGMKIMAIGAARYPRAHQNILAFSP